MYVQYSEGFPGIVLDTENEKVFVDKSTLGFDKHLEDLYAAYLASDLGKFQIGRKHAPGLYHFLGQAFASPPAGVKGQITGPFSWAMTVTDQNKQSIIYDDTLADAAAKLLRLKATWMEGLLRRVSRNTIVFLDEPYMTSFGSAFVNVSRDKVVGLLNEVFDGVAGLKGVHCCGNTDWSVLLNARADILNFDAYDFAASLALYPKEVSKFLGRGGVIAWGIVPSEADKLRKETVGSLKDRLEEAMAPHTKGFKFRDLLRQSLVTPSCGLASLPDEDTAELALQLLAELSRKMRSRYL
jgi:methionine synthase II (cobalamin-independent)